MSPIRVLVADDHGIFRQGVVAVLASEPELEIVGQASDGLEAIEKARQTAPDIVLMDLNMPRCSGLEATQLLQTQMPQASILILTVSDKEADLFAAVKFGARGYLLKNVDPPELIQAILHVARGGVMLSPSMAAKLMTEFQNLSAATEKPATPVDAALSPREAEVLQLVAQGQTNKAIADSLFISENTVKTHLRNIMDKLHLANRSQAAAYAAGKRLAKPGTA